MTHRGAGLAMNLLFGIKEGIAGVANVLIIIGVYTMSEPLSHECAGQRVTS